MSLSDPLATFPAPVREAHARWLDARDLAALDTVVLAIVAFHRSDRASAEASGSPEKLPDSARLIEDLGYDSLAMAEVVFFIEDLYKVAISNGDLRDLRTVADLRAYIRAKVAA